MHGLHDPPRRRQHVSSKTSCLVVFGKRGCGTLESGRILGREGWGRSFGGGRIGLVRDFEAGAAQGGRARGEGVRWGVRRGEGRDRCGDIGEVAGVLGVGFVEDLFAEAVHSPLPASDILAVITSIETAENF